MSTQEDAQQILRLARSVLRPDGAWSKSAFLATSKEGYDISALSSQAVSWSLLGALRLAGHRLGFTPSASREWPIALWRAQDMVEGGIIALVHARLNLVSFNRYPLVTQQTVLDVLDEALGERKQEAA
jgi:hypothetical protein